MRHWVSKYTGKCTMNVGKWGSYFFLNLAASKYLSKCNLILIALRNGSGLGQFNSINPLWIKKFIIP